MIRTLLKAVAYSKAPRATFTMLHPAKAVRFRKFQWDMRHAYAPRVTALGAAALALPVGLWLGRRRAEEPVASWQPTERTGHRPANPVRHDAADPIRQEGAEPVPPEVRGI